MTTPVQEHYGTADLKSAVLAEMEAAGIPSGQLSWNDLASFDQFHVRGEAATTELAASLSPSPGNTLLDIGCGAGGPARFLAAEYGCQVTGIDLSEPFIEVAKMLSVRTGLAGLTTFLRADALDLPFPDASFDFAWTQHVAMNIENRDGLYSEIRRILKPGGVLAIYDIAAGPDEPLIYPVPWARTADLSFLLTPENMRSSLEGAGFQVLVWADTSEAGLAWFAEQRTLRQASGGATALDVSVLMGPEFMAMAANVARNLRENRIRLIQAIVKRDNS